MNESYAYAVFLDFCLFTINGEERRGGSQVPAFAFTSLEAAQAWTLEHNDDIRLEWFELVCDMKWETTDVVTRFGDVVRYRIERCPMGA